MGSCKGQLSGEGSGKGEGEVLSDGVGGLYKEEKYYVHKNKRLCEFNYAESLGFWGSFKKKPKELLGF